MEHWHRDEYILTEFSSPGGDETALISYKTMICQMKVPMGI